MAALGWLLAATVGIVAACGADADLTTRAVAADRVFTGRVTGSGSFIGLAVDGDGRLTAYVCDGRPAGPVDELSVSVWFQGFVEKDAATATAGKASLQARFLGGHATGTVTVRGHKHQFTAPGATGWANLYRGADPPAGQGRRGRIALPDGQERGTAYPAYRDCTIPLDASRPACR